MLPDNLAPISRPKIPHKPFQSGRKSQPRSRSTYAIYIHYTQGTGKQHPIYWERRDTTANKKQALHNAHMLNKAYNGHKIEVIESYINARTNKPQERTIKIYENGTSNLNITPLKIALAVLFIALLCAGLHGITKHTAQIENANPSHPAGLSQPNEPTDHKH